MPKARMIEPTTPRTYTLERLQELRREADLVGDTASRDGLAAMIVERGGTVPTGEIPENETKVGRFERLRQDALAVNDMDSAAKLADLIAEESQLTEGGPEPDDEAPAEPQDAPRGDREENSDAIARLMKESDDKLKATVSAATVAYEQKTRTTDAPTYLQDASKATAPDPVNNDTASVNAAALIAKMGYNLSDIPARFGGKVDLTDVKHYRKILEEG
jgi:hypothetical protein